ncbi:hypothetical protein PLO_0200 [Pediococcus acidilactici NGRI 0510Q]|nr:hypothetical protein PLO_0200 [Pediococcus acidilactici NGRI 0510Q]
MITWFNPTKTAVKNKPENIGDWFAIRPLKIDNTGASTIRIG